MGFERDQPSGARDGGVIGAALIESDTEKVADAQGIGGAPGDTAFGINSFEIANQEGAEVDAAFGRLIWPGVRLGRPIFLA